MLRLPIQIYNMYHYVPGEELNNAFTSWFDYYLNSYIYNIFILVFYL